MRRRIPLMLFAVVGSGFAFGAATEPPPPKAAPLSEVKIAEAVVREDEPLPERAVARLGRMRDWRGVEGGLLAMPDGKHLVARFGDRRIRIWDADSGKVVGVSPVLGSMVAILAVSPDGKWIAAVIGKQITVLRASRMDESPIVSQVLDKDIRDVAFSPNGKLLASVADDKRVHVWDATDLRLLRNTVDSSSSDNLRAVAFTRDSKDIIICTHSGVVKQWRAEDLEELHKFQKVSSADGVHVLPDGKTVACISWNDGAVFWDIETGKITRKLEKYKGLGAFSPDGRWLATGPHAFPSSAQITLYDLKENREAFTLPGHLGDTMRFAFSPDSKTLHTYGHDHVVRHWDLTAKKEINPPTGHSAPITGAAFVDGGKTIATCSQDGTVRFWDAVTGKELRRFTGKGEHFMALALSPDRKALAISSSPVPSRLQFWGEPPNVNTTLHFWDLKEMKESDSRSLPAAVARRIEYGPDGAELMILDTDKVRLYDVKTGRERQPFNKATHGLHAAALSPDGKMLASATSEPTLRQIGRIGFWDLSSGREVAGHNFWLGGYRDLAYSPDGKLLAVAGSGGGRANEPNGLALWQASTDKVHRAFKTPRFDHYALAYSPDGRLVAAADSDGISVFEATTGEERWRFTGGHTESIHSLAFSDNAGRLLTAGEDGLAYVWDLLPVGKLLAKLDRQEVERNWNLLGDERAAEAATAMVVLAARPADSVPFFKERFGTLTAEEEKRIEALLIDLDSNQFRVRDKAARDLESLGELALSALNRAAQDAKRSVEVRNRAATLAKRIGTGDDPATSAAARRTLRAVEALEHAGTPEALALLKEMATRGRTRMQQEEAAGAVKRLTK